MESIPDCSEKTDCFYIFWKSQWPNLILKYDKLCTIWAVLEIKRQHLLPPGGDVEHIVHLKPMNAIILLAKVACKNIFGIARI